MKIIFISSFIIISFALSNLLIAQVNDTITFTQIRKESGSVKRFESNQITAFVNGHKTSIEILSLFRPEEIEMVSEHTADQSMNFMTNYITVKDTNHLVIRYFKEKARLLYQGKYFDHNDIPEMHPNQLEGLRYFKTDNGTGGSTSTLEVLTYGEEYVSNENIRFQTKPKTIKYYDIDGEIVDINEVRSYRLQPGEFISTIISGKEAVEKYGDGKYAEGVVVIIRNKKSSDQR
jgi:hypothetical protein